MLRLMILVTDAHPKGGALQQEHALRAKKNKVSGEVNIGIMRQDYDDSRFNTLNALAADAVLNYNLSPSTRLSTYLDRSIAETTPHRVIWLSLYLCRRNAGT
ncbi:MAG: hypothetical protein COY40_03810 [Alphaproteobacteria bacterium CG_4_10_14_0_8_um_filter_53_9]|nr:MAG: hypothetical protein COY40_03810 [Alphaproteobacteria bacterium CG_4_10_14_0_8_um_filter_53_9]